MFPPPKIEVHDGIFVARDDLLPGGTKLRITVPLFHKHHTIVYASPAYGGAQLALAHAARLTRGQAVIFVAKRTTPHKRTIAAAKQGARVFQVPYGYLSNVQSKAKRFAEANGSYYLEFGAEEDIAMNELAALGREVLKEATWDEVWTCAGSGVLSRGLQRGIPSARFHAVLVGRESNTGIAVAHRYPLPFEAEERNPAPFPSCPNYDRKAWHLCRRMKGAGKVLFWNVLGG